MKFRVVVNYTDLEQPPPPPKPMRPFFIEADDLTDATKHVQSIFAFGYNFQLFNHANVEIQDAKSFAVIKTMTYPS